MCFNMNLSTVLLIFTSLLSSSLYAENVCGDDWEAFKEEKCIKLFDSASLQTFADAEKTCTTIDAKLVSIHFQDKQTFLENYLFTKKSVVDNVWLGAKSDSSHPFHWEDGSSLTFANWAVGFPKVHSTETCVQMGAGDEFKGKWLNEPCAKKNLVVCEKKQIWSLNKIQDLLVKTMQNPVPVGFIYVQLPNQKSPQEIWPWMSWSEDSAQYDSLFFRVAGSKGAAAFGTVQEEFSPFVDEIKRRGCVFSTGTCPQIESVKTSRSGGWSGDIISAVPQRNGNGNLNYDYLNFHTAGGEVRPKNMAIKVWRRTA